jgi:hypothetical protein
LNGKFFIVLNAIIAIWGFRLFQITERVRRKNGIGAMAHKEASSSEK